MTQSDVGGKGGGDSVVLGLMGRPLSAGAPASGNVLSWNGREWFYRDSILSGFISASDYGAVGDGVTDNTRAIYNALEAANREGKKRVVFGAGTFLTDTITGPQTLTRYMHMIGSGQGVSTLKSLTGRSIFELTGASLAVSNITMEGFTLDGNNGGATQDGIHVHGLLYPPNAFRLSDLEIKNFGRHGIFLEQQFNTLLTHLDVTQCGDHALDLIGDNTLTLINVECLSVAPGKVGFRIHSGLPTLIGCNGVGGGGDFGLFGEAGGASTCKPMLVNCNCEDYGATGMYFYTGSFGDFCGVTWIAPLAGTVTAVKFEFANGGSRLDSRCSFATKGAAYTDGYAVHTQSGGAPFILSSTTSGVTQWRQDSDGSVFDLPFMKSHQNSGDQVSPQIGPSLGIGSEGPPDTLAFFMSGTADPVNPPTGNRPALYLRTDSPNQKLFAFLNGAWTQVAVP